MSAILGVFDLGGRLPDDATVRRMAARMRSRGDVTCGIWRDGAAVLAAVRYDWEEARGFAGGSCIAHDAHHAVVADASLYYRTELRQRLADAGVPTRSDAAAELILAAFGAWGDACVDRLDGDFAFIVWDRAARRVLCARDFVALRPLHYAHLGTTLVVASTAGGVLSHPDCPDDLNLTAIGEAVARFFAASHETGYRAVNMLLGGHTLTWHGTGTPRVARHWHPPEIREGAGPPFAEAAMELRERISRAVTERLAPDGTSSVWMSGGYDSTTLFAIGQQALARLGDGDRLRPVSISYPPGDPGREDEIIAAIAEFWRARVEWVNIGDVPMFDRDPERAADRDELFAHPFEMWNRALAKGSRRAGARVAFVGIGGDELFSGTDVYLADLFRRGRWGSLAREWQTRLKPHGWRYFVHQAVIPATPKPVLRAAELLLRGGRPVKPYDAVRLPPFMRRDFAREHGIEEREERYTPKLAGGHAAQQMHGCLVSSAHHVIRGSMYAFALEEGVQARIPLYDRRVIELAALRPQAERLSGRESKRLLRAAARGLLPDEVLAPRTVRTGITSGYFDRWMREQPPAWVADVLERPLLGELGVVDPAAVRRSWDDYLRWGDGVLGTLLYATMQTELWLRARLRPGRASRGTLHAAPASGDEAPVRVA